ncbi:MAG: type II secretion system F family protein [Pseudomonadota bacterium]
MLIGGVIIIGAAVVVFLLLGSPPKDKAAKRAAMISAEVVDKKGGKKGKSTDPAAQRRRKVEEQLRLQEAQQAAKKKVSLEQQIEQAGFEFSPKQFYISSGVSAVVGVVVGLLSGQNVLIIGVMIVAFGLGLPRFFLGHMRKRRLKKFLDNFSQAIDVIVRGVKTGLPVNDCLKLIATENPPPVGEEFHLLTEGIRVGMTLQQSLERMQRRVPIPEVQFFATVLIIQQKTGGNLGEALGNLSEVLRGRKSMEGKVKALSAEAKASAWILGSMPIVVAGLISVMEPEYLEPLYTTTPGKMILVVCAFWMSLGTIIMARMVKIKV